MVSKSVTDDFQTMVRGALCAECKQPLTDGAVYYNADTTKRTVHWNCRTPEDDPKKSEPQKI